MTRKATKALAWVFASLFLLMLVLTNHRWRKNDGKARGPPVNIIPYDPNQRFVKTARDTHNELFELDGYRDHNRLVLPANSDAQHNPRHYAHLTGAAYNQVLDQLDSNAFVTRLLSSMSELQHIFTQYALQGFAELTTLRQQGYDPREDSYGLDSDEKLRAFLEQTDIATRLTAKLDLYLSEELLLQTERLLAHPIVRKFNGKTDDDDVDDEASAASVAEMKALLSLYKPVLNSPRVHQRLSAPTLEAWEESLQYRLRAKETVLTGYLQFRTLCKRNFCSHNDNNDNDDEQGSGSGIEKAQKAAAIEKTMALLGNAALRAHGKPKFFCGAHPDDSSDMFYQSTRDRESLTSNIVLSLIRLSAALFDLNLRMRYAFGAPEFFSKPVEIFLHCNASLDDIATRLQVKTNTKIETTTSPVIVLPVGAPSEMPLDAAASINPFSEDNLAIIVSFRDRHEHLVHLRSAIEDNQSLKRYQRVHLFVIEEQEGVPFNRGKLFNVGFSVAAEEGFTQFVFHDVDMIPTPSMSSYAVRQHIVTEKLHLKRHSNHTRLLPPVHMSTCVEQFNWALPYTFFAGGNIMFTTEQFRLINGFSNRFWSWGGEDDDLWSRIQEVWPSGPLRLSPHCEHGRFNSMHHTPFLENDFQYSCRLFAPASFRPAMNKIEGLASLRYRTIQTIEKTEAITHILVEL